MDMLAWIKKNLRGVALVALAVVSGCVMINELEIYKLRPVKFSHVSHNKKKCKDCHREFKKSEEAGMPNPNYCLLCHKTDEDIKKYVTPFILDEKLIWTSVTELADEIVFSHKLHHDKEVQCEDCHPGIEENEAVSKKLRNSKDDCMKCHSAEKVAGKCETCHEKIDKEFEPPSHRRGWEVIHGQAVRAGRDEPFENRCELCHTNSACTKCHLEEEPRDHTGDWRHQGHGMAARMDRDRCAACHRSDYCDSCHWETSPRNHLGGWGAPANQHCVSCHLPLGESGCVTCHKSDPGHWGSRPLPGNITHTAATYYECKTCHTRNQTLRHLDKGDDCKWCHR